MKAAAALSALTMAVAAIAAPSEIEARAASSSCNTKTHKQVCCNFLSCLVQVLGDNCEGETYCCKTKQTGVVNVALLNCVELDL